MLMLIIPTRVGGAIDLLNKGFGGCVCLPEF
jgi:hypothetical protein